MTDLSSFIAHSRDRVDAQLEHWITPQGASSDRLADAMRYSVLNGGKRIRPVLVYASAHAISNSAERNNVTDIAAAAVECIHAYSLVHDDLPAMDDDDLRRGKPTCHIAFDEATAILVGDALNNLAFEKLAMIDSDPVLALALVRNLALAAGDKGMVAGQMIDLLAEGQGDLITIDQLERIHRHKTGALIKSAVLAGALSARANDEQLESLAAYAEAIGLAFQVQDDIIDVTSDTTTLGKQQGSDIALGKSTYVSLLGLDGARQKADALLSSALGCLASFDGRADFLRAIARYIVDRDN